MKSGFKIKVTNGQESYPLQDALDAMWDKATDEYVESHRQQHEWTFRAHNATKAIRGEAKRRAKPIIRFIERELKKAKLLWHIDGVELIDHSKSPPEVAPNFMLTITHPNALAYSVRLHICKPKSFRPDIAKRLAGAIAMCNLAGEHETMGF